MISAPDGAWKASLRSLSFLISSFIFHRASMRSQLRSLAEFCSRPRRMWSTSPRASWTAAGMPRVVAENWAKLSIQWIFQWRSWMSIASSRMVAHSKMSIFSQLSILLSRYSKLRLISGTSRLCHQPSNSRPYTGSTLPR